MATIETESLIAASGKRGIGGYTASRRYLFKFSEQMTEFRVLDETGGDLAFGARHPDKPGLFMLNKSAAPVSTAELSTWYVDCEWGRQTVRSQDEQEEGDDKPTRYDWRVITSDVPVDTDVNDNAIINPAGEGFDPPLIREHHDNQVVITKYVDKFSPNTAHTWFGKVNQVAWRVDGISIAPDIARIANVEHQEEWDNNGDNYFKLTITIDFRTDGWKRKVLNEGYRYKDGSDIKIAKDADDNALNEPVWLNANGTLNTTTTPSYTYFELYETMDFNKEDLT